MSLSAACGLDIVIHFDATVETVLARTTQYQKGMYTCTCIVEFNLYFIILLKRNGSSS